MAIGEDAFFQGSQTLPLGANCPIHNIDRIRDSAFGDNGLCTLLMLHCSASAKAVISMHKNHKKAQQNNQAPNQVLASITGEDNVLATNRALTKRFKFATAILTTAVLGFFVGSPLVLADGTDILEPTSAELANGSRFLGAGVGLALGQPEDIEITIPAGSSVEQVLIYWDGFDRDYAGAAPIIGVTTDTIEVAGNVVEGIFIGGRARSPDVQHFTFRADITTLNLVSEGPNSFTVGGIDFGDNGVVNGAGVMVIVDQGFQSNLQLFDGSDYAYLGCDDDFNCMETVKRTFSFPANDTARDAELTMFFAGVAGAASGGGSTRPSVIRIWVGGAPPIELINELNSSDGQEWDTLNIEFEVPAGVSQVEVQAFSEDVDSGEYLPASFNWIAAGFSIPEERRGGGYGCTPGYWKQGHHFDDWTSPFDPTDLFSDYLENAFPGKTLVAVLKNGGGGLDALGRHTVASLLNAANPNVSFDLTTQEVIDAFNDVYPGSKDDYESLKDSFQNFNEQGCPLNNSDKNGGNDDDDESAEDSPANQNGGPNADNAGPNVATASTSSTARQKSGGGSLGPWEILVVLLVGWCALTSNHRRRSQRIR